MMKTPTKFKKLLIISQGETVIGKDGSRRLKYKQKDEDDFMR